MTLETDSAVLTTVYMCLGCGREDLGEHTIRRDKHEISHYSIERF